MPTFLSRLALNILAAEKYKLYKKLSKVAAATSQRPSTSQPPITPPRHAPSRSRVTLIPRPVEVVAPLPGFNPFSPVKSKGKHRDLSSASTRKPPSSNPFATPSKNVPSPSSRSVSPDHQFLQVQPHSPIGISLSPRPPNTAVSRARKRLRGEPVSPSPNKQKRQRVGSHTALPFPKSHPLSSDDEDDSGGADANNCFVDDSPVKPPAGGKSFRLLFEDTLPATAPKKSATGLKTQSRVSDDAVKIDSNDIASLGTSLINAHNDSRPSKTHQIRQNAEAGRLPTSATMSIKKDEFLSSHNQTNKSKSRLPRTVTSEKQKQGKPPNLKASLKRPLSVVTVNDGLPSASCSQFPLLPPSPTHEDPSNHRVPANAKGKAGASRKKAKVISEEDEDEDSLDEVAVKVINRAQTAQQVSENADEVDWDPILLNGTHSRDPDADASDTSHNETGSFSVDLPDELRLMLAISPSRSRDAKQERVFRGLLYGDRVSHYDASRGGDIWDVGEAEDDTRGSTEGEDDWEGAPVPWEIGEL